MNEHIKRTVELLEKTDLEAVSALVEKLYEAYQDGTRVFICGNGGSAATASHFSEDLAKSTIKDQAVQKRLRVSSITDSVPFISALGNDWGYDTVFREQLVTNAEEGDILISISGSGNSPNVINAVQWAADNGLFTVGFSGFNGGKLKSTVDLCVHSPVLDMEIAENTHMVVVHLVVSGLRAKISEA
ncbi:MAG: SIS domain-containing protein, partial [Planctomycetes bacterium]|nr:SIS domain-containing protein [Planctomycetota bacterium]